jgi:hypothetical protein
MKGQLGGIIGLALVAYGALSGSLLTFGVCVVLAIVVFLWWPFDFGSAR